MAAKGRKAAGGAAKSFEQAGAQGQADAVQTSKALLRGFDEFAALGKQNFDAVVAANAVVAKGLEEIGREVAVYTQSSLESAASAARALFGARTLKDVVAVNNDYAKASFESFVANSTRISEIGVKAANEALRPLGAQVAVAIERLKNQAAA
jgi:phasin family protein